jgi:lipoprotein NlpI
MGKYDEAAKYYQRAVQLAPSFSFAAANRTLALYAGGKTDEAMREMRCSSVSASGCG